MNTARQQIWIESLGLSARSRPDMFLSANEVIGVPHAAAMRTGFNKLGLSGFFCIDSIPAIAFLTQKRLNRFKISTVHKALWNQGLVSLLLVILPEEMRAYSIAQTPIPEDTAESDDKNDKRFIRSFNLVADAVELSHIITGVESGRYFQDNKTKFDQKMKVDAVLLSNLRETEANLIKHKLTTETAQALLLQITFIAYLEDRGIIDPDYFKRVFRHGKIFNLKDLLNSKDPENLKTLFKKLHSNFNGDIFFAPCAFTSSGPSLSLTARHMQCLVSFREGNIDITTGQGRFWPYDFRFIPVELISSIYNRFLADRPTERRASGAYYTPHFLADLTVNQVWDEVSSNIKSRPDFKVLDPACGSAIFLVRIFQRIVEDWRREHPKSTPDWDTLVSIVKRLHGWDKEISAVRIGIFSLYIALLEEVEPPAILKLLDERKLLPMLFGKTMCDYDFFAESTPEKEFDIVIGNPPWVSKKKGDVKSAIAWCKSHNRPMPADELAWAFAWKGLHHVKPDGTIAFLLPAMGFLHNHSEFSIQARNVWLKQILLKKVINFSVICCLLVDGDKRQTTLCLFQLTVQEQRDYRFDYWCPKADPLLQTTRMLTLNRGDKVSLKISTFLHDPMAWSRYLWMTNRDMKLLGWLSSLSKLGKKLEKYSNYKKHSNKSKKWIIGHGFQPLTNSSDTPKTSDVVTKLPFLSDVVTKLPFLDANDFREWIIPNTILSEPWHTPMLRRLGFEKGFLAPHVLIPRGIKRSTGLLRATFSEQEFCFQDAIQAISFPTEDAPKLKLLTVILNSRFAAWFYFHETSSFGSDRALVDENQLLLLPFPEIDELPDPDAAKKAKKSIIRIIDNLLLEKDKFLTGQFPDNETIERLNQLVYQYYGLTEAEITVIEDTIKYVVPSIQPRTKKTPPLWNKTNRAHWQEYIGVLLDTLGNWIQPDTHITASLTTGHPDLVLIGLSLPKKCPLKSFIINETNDAFNAVLSRINDGLKQETLRNFYLVPDLRIFIDDTLFLIKPKMMRFWTKSAALNDADAIVVDLQSERRLNTKHG